MIFTWSIRGHILYSLPLVPFLKLKAVMREREVERERGRVPVYTYILMFVKNFHINSPCQ